MGDSIGETISAQSKAGRCRCPASALNRGVTFVFIVLLFLTKSAQALVPGNAVAAVLNIEYMGQRGTGFFFTHGSKQYVITSDHLMHGAPAYTSVKVLEFQQTDWRSIKTQVFHGPNECMDVAVLSSPILQLPAIPEPLASIDQTNYWFGQETQFFGFPYGLATSFTNVPGAFPVVKHGYISASVLCSAIPLHSGPSDRLILIDATANEGFSGGPVIVQDLNASGQTFRVLGIVKAYRNAEFSRDQIAGNSGITLVVPINEAIKLIDASSTPQKQSGGAPPQ